MAGYPIDTAGVGAFDLPRPRPGIRTTVYRTEPGTREFLFDENGMERPGAAAMGEDWLNYQRQKMDAMQQAGGNLQNSPQFASMAAEQDSGWKALNDRMMAQGEQAKGQAALTHANWEGSPENFAQQALASRIQSGQALPTELLRAGLDTTDEALAGQYKTGATNNILDAIAGLQGQGITSAKPGDPGYRALASSHPAALANIMAGKNPYRFLGNPDSLATTRGFFGQPAAVAGSAPSPLSVPGTPNAAPTPGVLRDAVPRRPGAPIRMGNSSGPSPTATVWPPISEQLGGSAIKDAFTSFMKPVPREEILRRRKLAGYKSPGSETRVGVRNQALENIEGGRR